MKTEKELEFERIVKEIENKYNFLEKVDNRETDPNYTPEQTKKEDEKYVKYSKELIILRKQLREIGKKLPKDSIYRPYEG